jgi:hypothetical protein
MSLPNSRKQMGIGEIALMMQPLVAAEAVKYDVTLNEHNELATVVRQPDGVAVPVDHEVQDFCDFLTWASSQSPPLSTAPYLIDKHQFFFCRSKPPGGALQDNGASDSDRA